MSSSTTNDRLQDTRESSRTSEGREKDGGKRMGTGREQKEMFGALGSKDDEDADESDGRAKNSREIKFAARNPHFSS